MNKERKKQIQKEIQNICISINNLEKILEDETDYYNNIPENLLSSSRADDSDVAIEQLTESIYVLNDGIDGLKNI